MSFDKEAIFDDPPGRNKLDLRDNRRLPAPSHDVYHSRRGEYLELPVHPLADEHVAREQREPDLLSAVLPSADGTKEGKIDLVPFMRKCERDGFLMLMASKKGVPVWCAGRALNFHFHFRRLHVALPSDLQGSLTPNRMDSCLSG